MTVPLFDTRSIYEPLRADVEAALRRVVESGRFILGPEVDAFESEFAAYLDVKHVIGVANGTDALIIALRALGIGAGDEVVVPSFTFYATAEAVSQTGARPVFCDIDSRTFCLTAETVATVLTPNTKALVGVHLFGNPAPIGALRELARAEGIALIEDAAQAAGARIDGRRAGSFGDASTFSFFPSKNLFCFGDGGAIATGDDRVAALARKLRKHGSTDKATFELIGYNSRLDEIQAAVLRCFLPRLDEWNESRRGVAAAYRELDLGEVLALPDVLPGGEHVYHLHVARTVGGLDRDGLVEALQKSGIGARAWYTRPLHEQPAMVEAFASQGVPRLPGTEIAARSNISLPMGPTLTHAQIEQVVGRVKELAAAL